MQLIPGLAAAGTGRLSCSPNQKLNLNHSGARRVTTNK
jgi:hypothetical protein